MSPYFVQFSLYIVAADGRQLRVVHTSRYAGTKMILPPSVAQRIAGGRLRLTLGGGQLRDAFGGAVALPVRRATACSG